MPILRKLREYLDQHEIHYHVLTHMGAYSAQETAHAQHIPGKQMAKVVMVKQENGALVMLVLPASHKVDFGRLRKALGMNAALAEEGEFREQFPECDVGAEPPFGNLFNIDTLLDPALAENDEIVFNAGSHWQMVRMRYEDYTRLVHPRVATFTQPL
jgi:Ala-tRNA(Pro) deacylase